jgi:transposase-like protein
MFDFADELNKIRRQARYLCPLCGAVLGERMMHPAGGCVLAGLPLAIYKLEGDDDRIRRLNDGQ